MTPLGPAPPPPADNEEFEDLDEILARHVSPISAHARDLLNYKYYKDTDGGKRPRADEILREEKRKNPQKIPYIVSVSKVSRANKIICIFCCPGPRLNNTMSYVMARHMCLSVEISRWKARLDKLLSC